MSVLRLGIIADPAYTAELLLQARELPANTPAASPADTEPPATPAAGDLLTDVTRRATDHHARVAACGEGTSILWSHGHAEAAIQIEHLLDEVAMSRQMDILCAYPLAARDESVPAARRLCAEHTAVEIS